MLYKSILWPQLKKAFLGKTHTHIHTHTHTHTLYTVLFHDAHCLSPCPVRNRIFTEAESLFTEASRAPRTVSGVQGSQGFSAE